MIYLMAVTPAISDVFSLPVATTGSVHELWDWTIMYIPREMVGGDAVPVDVSP